MRIDTFGRLVLGQVEGTKLSLVEKHIEVFVLGVVVNQIGQNFLLTMRIRTKISIRTLIHTIGVVKAKIFFIFLITIVLLDKRMSIHASLPIRTLHILLYIITHLRSVEITITPTILRIMIVNAMLVVVSLSNVTGIYLENLKIKVLHQLISTITVGAVLN